MLLNSNENHFYPKISAFISSLDFSKISETRKKLLNNAAEILKEQYSIGELKLVFVCTHNSRRSQFGQIWAAIAASYFDLAISVFSAGTEETACFSETIQTLKRAGFVAEIENSESKNPVYKITWSDNAKNSTLLFSKDLHHKSLPKENFVAIMTCDDADQNCPVVLGATSRISLTYTDPKIADSTPLMQETYDKTSLLIANEIFYLFNQITK